MNSLTLYQQKNAPGQDVVYLSPYGMRWQRGTDFVTVAWEPSSWNVSVFDEQAKVMYTGSRADYAISMRKHYQEQIERILAFGFTIGSSSSFVCNDAESICGLKTRKYIRGSIDDDINPMKTEIWIAQDFSAPFSLMNLPVGLPEDALLMRWIDTDNSGSTVHLDTLDCVTTEVAPGLFQVPSGYTMVQSPHDVINGRT